MTSTSLRMVELGHAIVVRAPLVLAILALSACGGGSDRRNSEVASSGNEPCELRLVYRGSSLIASVGYSSSVLGVEQDLAAEGVVACPEDILQDGRQWQVVPGVGTPVEVFQVAQVDPRVAIGFRAPDGSLGLAYHRFYCSGITTPFVDCLKDVVLLHGKPYVRVAGLDVPILPGPERVDGIRALDKSPVVAYLIDQVPLDLALVVPAYEDSVFLRAGVDLSQDCTSVPVSAGANELSAAAVESCLREL